MKENMCGAGDMKKIEYICVNRTSERLKRLIDYKQQQEGDEQIEYEHDTKQYDNTRLRNHVARRTAIGAKHT
ncbi:unnamed protein product, partial [Didymodactylos carnosus]